MKTDDFNYYLPENLIAQTPLKEREQSRLMVLDKSNGKVEHSMFKNILNYLSKGDILVLNDSKVIPARLIGEKEDTGAIIEILLLKNLEGDTWECLVKPARRIKEGTTIVFGNSQLKAQCLKIKEEGIIIFKLIYKGILYEILDELGDMPLPPYIHQKLNDKDRYQTVYAKNIGSVAAPTAGLHFTEEIINKLKEKGVKVVFITLHVGLGTFRPVSVNDITNHKMHSEYYEVSSEVSAILNEAKQTNNNIVCVGTTTARTLETILRDNESFVESRGWTDIFIYPGFKFKAVDCLLTNFHLPKSTLIMLVSALAGKENLLKAYNEAVKKEYRFFSFGDCMLIK